MARVPLTVWMVLSLLAVAEIAVAQNESDFRLVSLGPQPKVLEPAVDFLEQCPVIDGRLDDSLEFLPERPFTFAYVTEGDSVIPASYRLAYGTSFFYVYIEVAADQLTFRDRAYQNGDGFHMVIAAPQPDQAPSGEFYVLACSAVNKPSQEWSRRIFWYYNVDKIFVPTSDDAKLECHQGDGKISFELLLPWSDVHPYHPWLSPAIGFNLRFVKALEPDRAMLLGVVDDPYIDGEQRKRQYALLSFKQPVVRQAVQTFAQPTRGHITKGDSLEIASVCIAPGSTASEMTVSVYSGEGERIVSQRVPQVCTSAVARSNFWLNTSGLPVGGYTMRWSGGNTSHGERGLTILPATNIASLATRIAATANRISVSSVSTLQFLTEEAQHKYESMYPYETCGELRIALNELLTAIDHAERGEDELAHMTGFVRKAYRSRVDGTLQPYMVWLPSDYHREKTYPLMVYLHGSASDERSFTKRGARDIIPDGFIAVAPYGRGQSNAFSADHAQEDIAEAIDAVAQEYSIDTSAILLSGFSMGGYGVLRTAYETPGKFKALAIMSGDPNLAQRYSGDTMQPNFLDNKNLRTFRSLPIFVFHGEKDRNAPYESTRELVGKLKEIGADVMFISEPEKGHDFPNASNTEKYREWVAKAFATSH